MKAPRTYFSTQLRTGPTAVRRRLKHLFTAPRRPGIFPLICILILVGLLGCLVACKTDPGQSSPAPSASGAVQPPENSAAMGQIGEGVDVPDAVLSAARAYVQEQYDYWSANTGAMAVALDSMGCIQSTGRGLPEPRSGRQQPCTSTMGRENSNLMGAGTRASALSIQTKSSSKPFSCWEIENVTSNPSCCDVKV